MDDNTLGWQVSLTVTPPKEPVTYGPIPVSNREVATGLQVRAGSTVKTQESGKIFFGVALVPTLDAEDLPSTQGGVDYDGPHRRRPLR